MRALVKSLKRLYENGLKGKVPSLTKEEIRERVDKGTITEGEYKDITGEDYGADESDGDS